MRNYLRQHRQGWKEMFNLEWHMIENSKGVTMGKGKLKKGKENILCEKINLISLVRGMEQ